MRAESTVSVRFRAILLSGTVGLLGLPARRPGFKSRQTPMDFSMGLTASTGGSEPTLNCRTTVSLEKRGYEINKKTMAKRLRNQQKLKSEMRGFEIN